MNSSTPPTAETERQHAEILLMSIGVSRIVVVDDEYSEGRPEVEELLGICTVLRVGQAVELPHLDDIDFEADREIWAGRVRERWPELGETERKEILERAHSLAEEGAPEAAAHGSSENKMPRPGTVAVQGETDVPEPDDGDAPDGAGPADPAMPVDTRAAKSLEVILDGLDKCTFVPLSLTEWRKRADELLTDDTAATTMFLFDRDFGLEQEAGENEGFNLVREVQGKGVGYCGLISHTIQLGSEYEASLQLADEHGLARDKFVVIAKERLTGEAPDQYSFLRMLRLVALSGPCAGLKSAAWSVFAASVIEAEAAVERLSVRDFDQIVLASSRREGVWEPATLFRVFGILMRQEAQTRLYKDADILRAVTEARRISAIPEKVVPALGEEKPSREALRIQRFEIYESAEALSRFYLPLELGDIFERLSTGRRYILLTQPCDLMVRRNGKRSYDDKYGRTGALVELVMGCATEGAKESWKEVPSYDQDTGAPAYADFAKVHQVQLAVLDLCALREDGVALIEIGAACPELLIDPWKKRYERLQKFFEAALDRYEKLGNKRVEDEMKSLALPVPSTTVRLAGTVRDKTVRYSLKRVMRLRQPWSGALLSAFAQYQARAAFEHPFDDRVPVEVDVDGGQRPDEEGATDTPA